MTNEQAGGRLELTGARARMLLDPPDVSALESSGGKSGPPNDRDAKLIANRISIHSSMGSASAMAVSEEIVDRARTALVHLQQSNNASGLSDTDALALESVMHVRGRPAIRVLAKGLESLEYHPGSEFWQEFIGLFESQIVSVAAVTGAVLVTSFSTGNSPWVQGSAWLNAADRVVTNRHVLAPPSGDGRLIDEAKEGGRTHLRTGYSLAIEFAADNREEPKRIQRRVIDVLYVAKPRDPVDIAVLAIEPYDEQRPLQLANVSARPPKNLFVVGHPGLLAEIPYAVRAVFGNPDGKKRVSFGKLLDNVAREAEIAYDASTIGGYSGGPVVGIGDDAVAGLHYLGDPVTGNLAISAEAIRRHQAYQHVAGPL